MIQLSIVVPCYNEAKNIPLILKRFSETIHRDDIEVILVNNGSTDNSSHVMNEHIPQFDFARCVTLDRNQGYGFGIISGLREAKGEFIGYTHADLQTDPNDCIKAYDLIQQQDNPTQCYVKGNRIKRPWFDQCFTLGMSLFETLYLKKKLWDINAQPNLFHRTFFDALQELPYDFSLDLFLLYQAKKKGLTVLRFDVLFPERIHGTSSWNHGLKEKYKFIKRTLAFSVTLKKRL